MSTRAKGVSRLYWGVPTSKLMHMDVGRTQVLRAAGQGPVPHWLLAKGSLSSLPHGFSIGQFTTGQLASLRGSEQESKTEASVFYNLMLEVISLHFCCVLFTRRKSLGPPTRTGRLHKGVITMRQ